MSESECVGEVLVQTRDTPWPVLPCGCFFSLRLAMTLIADLITHVGSAVDGRQCQL